MDRCGLNCLMQEPYVPKTTERTGNNAFENTARMNDDFNDSKFIQKSPCGRWKKSSVLVKNFLSGAHCNLGMDVEEGIEVVWCEVSLKKMKPEDFEVLQNFFKRVINLDHMNVLKVLAFWIEAPDNNVNENEPTNETKPSHTRLIIITESISGENIQYFIKRYLNAGANISFCLWRKFCRQLLGGISYLHSQSPPYILGYFSSEFVFMAHGPILKIAAFMPLLKYVISIGENILDANWIKIANLDVSDDIFSFGLLALKMASPSRVDTALGVVDQRIVLGANGNVSQSMLSISLTKNVREKIFQHFSSHLEFISKEQRDLITLCMKSENEAPMSARQVLKHSSISMVPMLKVLIADQILDTMGRMNEKAEKESLLAKTLAVVKLWKTSQKIGSEDEIKVIFFYDQDKRKRYEISLKNTQFSDLESLFRRMHVEEEWKNILIDYKQNLFKRRPRETYSMSSQESSPNEPTHNTSPLYLNDMNMPISLTYTSKKEAQVDSIKYQSFQIISQTEENSTADAFEMAAAEEISVAAESQVDQTMPSDSSSATIESQQKNQSVTNNSTKTRSDDEMRRVVGCFVSILDSKSRILIPPVISGDSGINSYNRFHQIFGMSSVQKFQLSIKLMFEDDTQRTLLTHFHEDEDSAALVKDLVFHNLIHHDDENLIKPFINNIKFLFNQVKRDALQYKKQSPDIPFQQQQQQQRNSNKSSQSISNHQTDDHSQKINLKITEQNFPLT